MREGVEVYEVTIVTIVTIVMGCFDQCGYGCTLFLEAP